MNSKPAPALHERRPYQVTSSITVIVISVFILSAVPAASSFNNYFNSLKNLFGIETCSHPHVRDAVTAVESLRNSLEADLFGQHLAKNTIITAMKMHLDDPSPKKAMVLSLHGWAGSEKTFTTQLITKALYEKGDQSDFVKYFSATYHFPDPKNVSVYKMQLKREVIETIKKCERALFIFDEVDKLPAGLLNELGPFIKPAGTLERGVNPKKSVFLFLSNLGATLINDITWNWKEDGKEREDLQLKDFEEIISNEAFGVSKEGGGGGGGLYKSELIEKILVDWFIPFLPLEREHVKSCINRDIKNLGGGVGGFKVKIMTREGVEEIARRLTYWPEDKLWFSMTGCKRVESLVKFQLLSDSSSKVKREL